VANPTLLITKLDPSRGPEGGGNSVTITGDNLTGVTAVTFGSAAPVTPQSVTGTSIVVAAPQCPETGGATVSVTVAIGTSGAVSPPLTYVYVPAPVITAYNFDDWVWWGLHVHHTGRIKVTGDHFADCLGVFFGGTPASSFEPDGASSIVATRSDRTAGAIAVTVATPGGTSNAVTITARAGLSRFWVFCIETLYMLSLLTVGLLYVDNAMGGFWRQSFPDPLASVPLGVYWFGALGAVALSLSGVVYHAKDWDPSYVFWYLSRPLLGAVFAVVVYLIFAGGIVSAGGNPGPATGGAASTAKAVQPFFYYVIAFVIGYREASFRNLLSRVGDLIFGAGQTSDTTAATTSQPAAQVPAATSGAVPAP
jgi:hypothetical protein